MPLPTRQSLRGWHRQQPRPFSSGPKSAPQRVRHSRPPVVRCQAAAKDADTFASTIRQAEEAGDWLTAFEALTEASAMQVSLPREAMEGGIRTLAQGGQAQRSATLLQQLLKQPSGGAPSGQTILSVFEALYKQKQAVPAEELLAVLQSHDSIDNDVLHPAHNLVVRAVARSGSPVVAYERLEKMVTGKQTITVEMETFTCVCHELMKVNESDKAEEVLEWRDFLSGE